MGRGGQPSAVPDDRSGRPARPARRLPWAGVVPFSVDRRQLLRLAAVAAAATATGCSSSAPGSSPTRSPSPEVTPRPPAPSLPPALPAVPRWTPSPRETVPALKTAAADVVQALCTRRPGQTVADALASLGPLLSPRLDSAGALRVLAPLGEGRVSTGEIVYPQYGGLAPIAADATTGAAMVVVRHRMLSAAGVETTVTRTVDVRLERQGQRWQVTAVPSVGGEPVARPTGLHPIAASVLDDPRVRLPDSARWDIHAGRVSLDLLDLLAGATALGPVGVTVLASGHPREVFGTGSVSAHTVGRAVDIWQLAGIAVVDDRSPGGPTAQLQAAALLDRRTAQVGSPPGTDADGPRSRRSFANLVHEDHLHLAVRP